jgi:tetratricopeptide (TPR) repeat protein
MNSIQLKTKSILLGLTLLSGVTFGQKMVETDAIMNYKSFETAFQAQDMPSMKKSILKAKDFIDKAAAHPDTQKSPKTLFYKGEIYMSLILVAGMANDPEFTKLVPEDADKQAVAAYKEAYTTSDKFDPEIKQSVVQIQNLMRNGGSMAFEKKMYKEAMEAFASVNQFTQIIGQTDTLAIYYAGVSAENDTNWVEAAKYYRQCADLNYKPESIYRSTAVAYIKANQKEEALTFLQEAIKKSPRDKHLYFALGTIAMDMGNDDLVLENLNKAVEVDPKYADAYYNLGSYFSSKGLDLRKKSNDLPANAKKESDAMLAESLVFYKKALDPLEKYIALEPKDVEVLNSLVKIARALGDAEKEAKYKQMLDAARQ